MGPGLGLCATSSFPHPAEAGAATPPPICHPPLFLPQPWPCPPPPPSPLSTSCHRRPLQQRSLCWMQKPSCCPHPQPGPSHPSGYIVATLAHVSASGPLHTPHLPLGRLLTPSSQGQPPLCLHRPVLGEAGLHTATARLPGQVGFPVLTGGLPGGLPPLPHCRSWRREGTAPEGRDRGGCRRSPTAPAPAGTSEAQRTDAEDEVDPAEATGGAAAGPAPCPAARHSWDGGTAGHHSPRDPGSPQLPRLTGTTPSRGPDALSRLGV